MSSSKKTPRAPRGRLDLLLVERGLFESREKAQSAILAGEIFVNEERVTKAGRSTAADAKVEVRAKRRHYVGRGAYKLLAALNAFAIEPRGRICLDVGASTGGFTEVLLERGAKRVYAIDVGHNQLAFKLRQDPRVIVREGLNARYLTPDQLEPGISLAVLDLSFISLTLVLPAVLPVVVPGGELIALIKPQFEAGREEIPRGGVVVDEAVHERMIEKIRRCVEALPGAQWEGVIPSPITGTDGNREFLAWIRTLSLDPQASGRVEGQFPPCKGRISF